MNKGIFQQGEKPKFGGATLAFGKNTNTPKPTLSATPSTNQIAAKKAPIAKQEVQSPPTIELKVNNIDSKFVDLYMDTTIKNSEKVIDILKEIVKKTQDLLNNYLGFPVFTDSKVNNYEIQTLPDFISESFSEKYTSVYSITAEMAKIFYLMNICLEKRRQESKGDYFEYAKMIKIQDNQSDEIKLVKQLYEILQRNEDNVEFNKRVLKTIKAAIALFLNDDDETRKYFNSDVFEFLSEVLLKQTMLCTSRIFTIILECFAKIFVERALTKARSSQKEEQSSGQKALQDFNRGKINQSSNNQQLKNIISYFKLVTTMSTFWPTSEFAEFFLKNGKDNLQYTHDNLPDDFFCAFVDLLTSLCKSKQLTNEVVIHVKNLTSETVNFVTFSEAIIGYKDDLESIERRRLTKRDSLAMESVLRFLSVIAHYNEFKVAIGQGKVMTIITSLLSLTLSSIPATLKAASLDLIAAIAASESNPGITQLWDELRSSMLITQEYLDQYKNNATNNNANLNYSGLLAEIEKIEKPSKQYHLVRSFIRLLANFFSLGNPSTSFEVYHSFLSDIVLENIDKWSYEQNSEKWGLVIDISQCFENIVSYQINNPDRDSDAIIKTILTDQVLIRDLLEIICADTAPLEALLCVYRLLYLLTIAQKNKSLDISTFSTVEDQISGKPDALFKLLKCTACCDRDLQIIAIHLLTVLCTNSPNVVQIILSKPKEHAIEIINYVLKDVDDDEVEDEMNVKCSMLQFLLSLRPESYFLRYICGFDLHDQPLSILRSNLTDGILNTLLDKLHIHDTHIFSPKFTAMSLKLLLKICENNLTTKPVLNLLLSSKHSFFKDQLSLLRDSRCRRTTIGCYLQLLAREAAQNSDAIFSGSSADTFEMLLSSAGGSENSERNILILEFIDKIDGGNESLDIANGVKEIVITFFNNVHARERMDNNQSSWVLNWTMFISTILEKIVRIPNPKITQTLVESAAPIAYQLFTKRVFGKVEPEGIVRIFGLSLQAIISLSLFNHTESRTALYSILQSTIYSLFYCEQPVIDECKRIFQSFENNIISSIMHDTSDSRPIMESAALSAAEAIVPIASEYAFSDLVESTLSQIETDWTLYKEDQTAGSYVIKAKCSFYSKLISSCNNPNNLRIFIDKGLCYKLSSEFFWNDKIQSCYSECSNSEEAEVQMKMASAILKLFASFMTIFRKSEDAERHVKCFLLKFENVLVSILNSGGRTTNAGLQFINDLLLLIAIVPKLETLKKDTLVDSIPHVFSRFANPNILAFILTDKSIEEGDQSYQANMVSDYSNKSKEIVSSILKSCIYFLVKRTDYVLIFDPPLDDDSWKTRDIIKKRTNEKPPLAIIKDYLRNLLSIILENIKKEEEKQKKEEEKKNKKNGADENSQKQQLPTDQNKEEENDDPNRQMRIEQERRQNKTIVNMCLLIIWRHIDNWSANQANFDASNVKTQADVFTKNPFSSPELKKVIDQVILKKLINFAKDN